MRNLKRTFWGTLAVLVLLWLIAEPSVFQSATFFARRGAMVQLSGVLAIGCMSIAMILALRPRWPESWLGGLDKMYRLHKWLGITALVVAIVHWLSAQGPKWAVGWGVLERPARGARPAIESPIEAIFADLRGSAEGLGEWAFYATVVLVALALTQYFPYRLFYKTHRLLALAYLVLVFHAVVLIRFSYWTSPLGWVMMVLLACGTWAAVLALLRRAAGQGQDHLAAILSRRQSTRDRNRGAARMAGPRAGPVRLRHVGRLGGRASLHHRVQLARRDPRDYVHHQGAG